MNFRRFIVLYRLPLAAALIALGFWLGFAVTWWIAWIPFLIAAVFIFAYFFIGPMTLMQGYMEAGDMEGVNKLLNSIKFPNLLYKPIRSQYYMLKANMSSMDNNLDQAEADIRKGLESGLPEKEYEGTAYLQLGQIALQKGNMKDASEHLRKAIKIGLTDANHRATAYLYLTQIEAQRRNYKSAKLYFQKVKQAKPTEKQILDQVKEIDKQLARMPG